jgi:hypothetical protein
MKQETILAILALVLGGIFLAGCETTPPPEPPLMTGIAVTALDKGRLTGGRAVYSAHVPIEIARAVILDFDHQAEFRPAVAEARTIASSPQGGQVFFKFAPKMGIDVNATCDYTVTELDGAVRIEYEMTDSSFALWAMRGAFTLASTGGGEWTAIDQEVLISALVSNREALLDDLRADAAAIQKRMEEHRPPSLR